VRQADEDFETGLAHEGRLVIFREASDLIISKQDGDGKPHGRADVAPIEQSRTWVDKKESAQKVTESPAKILATSSLSERCSRKLA
jgi:hypothetical protein